MVGALSILRTTLFLTRTFVLVQSNLMHLPTIRTEAAKRSFYYHGSMVFNSYCQGGRCLQGNLWYSPPASMTSRLPSVTFKMAKKMFIEETD